MSTKHTLFQISLLAALVLSPVSAPVLAAPRPAPVVQISWYDANWPYRKPITIDHTQVEADLTGFPVLIRLGADADLAARAQDSGDDILFTDYSGGELNHEIEYFDGSTGELVAWVNVPNVSSTTDTLLYMYYGNAGAANQENPEAVWDADYVMVQHLEETSGTHFDSTQYANDGIPSGATAGLIQDAAGEMDGADDFSGDGDFIDVGTQASMDIYGPGEDFSIFTWVKRDDTSAIQGFFSSGSSGNFGIYFGSASGNEDDLRFMSTANTVQAESSGGVIGDTGWHYVGVVADRDGNLDLWADGTLVYSEGISAHSSENWSRLDDTYKIGTDRSESNPMDGLIDEVRVSRIARSAAWIRAEYNNVVDANLFYDVGSQQQVNVPVISSENPADGSAQVSVSLAELSFHIEDPEGDPMDFDVTTSPDIGSRSETAVSDGTYTVSVSGLDYGQTVTWYVDVTDGTHTASEVFSFTTESDVPIISSEAPADGAANVGLNPTLQAHIHDQQGDSVEWEIEVDLDGSWELMNSGSLPTGSGTVSATAAGVGEYDTTVHWRVRARDAGSGTWVEETYHFTTIENQISFAAFADTHIGGEIETGWGMADHLDDLTRDTMSNTIPCDFTVHLGDIIMHSTAYVEGEGLPPQHDPYENNFKAFLLQHINMPFMAISGNHDLNDYYGESHAGYPHNGDDPFNLVRKLIDATEMNSYPYAFMKNNILFIALPETDYHMFTKPIIYEYVEYMTRRYPENTTVIFSHQAIEDTTIHDGSATSTYRGKQDRAWWAELFRNNPQIKMWIHGHQHMLDWYQSDHSSGLTYPVEDFGHEMVFSMPYSQADWGGYFEEDRIVIYSVSPDGISTRAWENNGAGGHWVSGYDHNWNVETTYDETAQDWYSFPIFVQDGEIQMTDMKAYSPNMTLELIGTQAMELFYDPTMATQGTTWGGENLLGFGDDTYSEATPTLPGMTVHGPADLDFPPKYPGSAFQGGSGAYHEDGRTGQPYHFFPVGTTHAAVPGATYDVVITARSNSGAGRVHVDLSTSDWGTRSQYSTLAGSTQRVISHTFGTTYETVIGTYTVPYDDDAWFLQGYLDFVDATDYDVSLFSIKRSQDTATTDDFGLSLNGTWYNHPGTLQQYERAEFVLNPVDLADENGVIEITASVQGNHFGMARVLYNAPVLMGRNARFTVNSVDGNRTNITLQDDLSYYADTFKMFPLSRKYGSVEVTSDDGSAVKRVSGNGNEWIECNTPTETTQVTLDIEYGPDAPVISAESPANFATGVSLNPTLQAYVNDLQGDPVDWEIKTNAGGTWQTIESGTLPSGQGTVAATPTSMGEYGATYFWSVSATDAGGSGETVEEVYRFTTRPEPGTWWGAAWAYRKEIAIDHTMVDADLTAFPVLIDITDPDLAAYAQNDGDDVAFVDYNGTRLSHEIVRYDDAAGHLIVWVNVPSLSSSEDTILYMYFGNGAADNQENVEGTWDRYFVMVQHLEEPSGTHYDSTANGNDGTTVVVTDQNATGQINGADAFDGADDHVRVPNDGTLQFGEGSVTAEAWIYPRSVPDTGGARVVNNRGTGAGGQYRGWQLKIADATGRWKFKDTGIDDGSDNYRSYEGTTAYGYDQWVHVAMVYDVDNELVFYVNGAVDGTLPVGPYGSIANDLPTAIGGSIAHEGVEGADNKQFFDGIIDEVKLSNVARSAGWVSTSYNNQSDPDAFVRVGSLELASGPPEVANPVPADGTANVSTSLSLLSFHLYDPDGDVMDYTVTTNPDVGSGSAAGVADGTYVVSVAGLAYDTTYTWTITATDGTDETSQAYSFTTERPPAEWWDNGWAYRKKITIDHTQVMEDLTDFPVMIEIDDGSLASFVQDGAGDIVFTDYDGVRLDHEIESYDPATGALVAWVRVPSLSSMEDTTLYMYYGNSEASNQENPEPVWDQDYVLVHHLDETSGTHYDSTAYGNDGTPHNLASQDAAGQIDGADEFHDRADLIDVGTDPSLDVFGPDQDFSIFAWVKRDDVANVHGFFSSGSDSDGGMFFGTAWQNEDDLKFLSPGNTIDVASSVSAVGDTNWHYVGVTADRDGDIDLWVDGGSVHSASIAPRASEDWNRRDDTYKIGTDRSESGSLDGVLDEIRVSKVLRSPGWIQTSYNNQVNPGAFTTITQEPDATYQPPTVTLVSPEDRAIEEAPVSFGFIPQSYSPGGATRAELWLNITETVQGGVVYTDNTYAPQRAVIKDGKLVQSEGTGHGCRITVRDFPAGNILKESPVFGTGNHSNTSVVIEGDIIYGICTDGAMLAWNEVTEAVVWQTNVGPGGSYSTTSNSMEVYDGHIYVQSADFVIHKIAMATGTEVASMALENTGSDRLKAHMLVDADNDRLYALGDSHYYAIDLITFSEIWSIPIVANGGRDTRGGPILVDDSHSGQALTIFTTFPQDYTYAVDFDGNIVWTWTEKPVRASATYNPNTGLIYVSDATGYTDSGLNLPLPGSIYALHVNDGSVAWVSHGDGTDKFARPVTASGNYLVFKTDNNGSTDYLYVLDATTGATLAKISAGGDRGYWCFPPAVSGGYVATGGGYADQGGNVLDIYRIGAGESVDYYPLHGNVHHTGYVPGGLTNLGLITTSWQLANVSDTPIVDGVVNHVDFDFASYSLPYTVDWNIRLVQSDNQSAWGAQREINVLPVRYDDGWPYRRMVIIDHTKVNDDLTDFPVLIQVTDDHLASMAQSDGDDILFADSHGVKLDHEIEDYDSTTGGLTVWVRVPFLSATRDTVLYMYYGNASAGNQENAQGVWDSNFVMVQHLDETSGTHYDSTLNDNDGTTVVVMDQDAAGQIDGADRFDGTITFVRVPNDASLQFGEGGFTAEAWIYPESVRDAGGARIVNNRGTGGGGQHKGWQLKIADAAGQWKFRDCSIDDAADNYQSYEGTTTYGYRQWVQVVMVYDADQELRFYANGGLDGTVPVGSYGDITNDLPTIIGASLADGGVEGADDKQYFNGIIDEVRLSNVARSAGWISTSYNNQNDPGSFVIVPEADLELDKSVDNASPHTGEDVVFTVALTNNGPAAATGVEVEDALLAGFSYVSDDSDGAYDPGTGVWEVGSLASGDLVTLTLIATVADHGTFTNSAQVSAADQFDPDSTPGNDDPSEDDQDEVAVSTPEADLELQKIVDDGFPRVGDDVVFAIALANSGPDVATGIEVEDILPAGLSYVSDDGAGAYDPGTGVWEVGSLAGGDAVTLTLTVTVADSGTFTNTAQVLAADQFDPDSIPDNDDPSEDDQASAGLRTGHGAAVSIQISPAHETVTVGERVTFHATAGDASHNTWDVTAKTIFSIDPEAGGSWANNVYTSEVAGDWTVTGEYSGLEGVATIHVCASTPTSSTIYLPIIKNNTVSAASDCVGEPIAVTGDSAGGISHNQDDRPVPVGGNPVWGVLGIEDIATAGGARRVPIARRRIGPAAHPGAG